MMSTVLYDDCSFIIKSKDINWFLVYAMQTPNFLFNYQKKKKKKTSTIKLMMRFGSNI